MTETVQTSDKRKDKPKPRKRSGTAPKAKKPSRKEKPYPLLTFEEALQLPEAIQTHAGTHKIRRTTLFDHLNKSPTSGHSRALVTNSSKYGLTTGSYSAEHLVLTDDGNTVTSNETTPHDLTGAQFRLAIEGIEVFKKLHEKLTGNKLPSREVLIDMVDELGVEEKDRSQCVDIFISNAKYVGLLKVLSGAERVVPLDHVIEELQPVRRTHDVTPQEPRDSPPFDVEATMKADFSKTCFFIAPIGDDESEDRKHSDMILAAFLEQALEGSGLLVVRADKITEPGMITSQVIQYILKSKVVVADLSFHNPNVFYELAIRHMTGLPTVHIIRKDDKLPFDLKDFRTITIDTSDKYHLVASLDSYRSEIANFVRIAQEGGDGRNNPILAQNPTLKVSFS